MATKTYVSGTGNASGCTWSPSAPTTGDNVIINTSSNSITWDIAATFGTFTIDTGYSGIVTQTAAFGCTAFSLNAGYFLQGATISCTSFSVAGTGDFTPDTYTITCSGNFIQSGGGAIAGNSGLIVDMSGTGSTTLTILGDITIAELIVSGSGGTVTLTDHVNVEWRGVVINSNCKLHLDDDINHTAFDVSQTIDNNGIIEGSGTFYYCASGQNLAVGTINCPFYIYTDSTVGSDFNCNLTVNQSFGSNLTVASTSPTYIINLAHGDNYTLSVTGLTTLGTKAKMTQGTGTWTFTGGLTQSGTSNIFTQGGNISLAGLWTISAGTFYPNATYTVTTSEGITYSGGSIDYSTANMNLVMNGNAKVFQIYLTTYLRSLTVNDNTTLTSTDGTKEIGVDGNTVIATGKTLTLSAATIITVNCAVASSTFENLGTIAGTGGWGNINPYNRSCDAKFGTINIPWSIYGSAGAGASHVVTMTGNAIFGSSLDMMSDHATYTITLAHGTNYTLAVTGLTTLGNRGVMTQGTGTWTFTGGYTQNGASSVFTQGGAVSSGTVIGSAGGTTGAPAYKWTCTGDWTASGTFLIAYDTVYVKFTTDGSVLTHNSDNYGQFYGIQVSANISSASSAPVPREALVVDTNKTLTINAGTFFEIIGWNCTITNNGHISTTTTGYIKFFFYSGVPQNLSYIPIIEGTGNISIIANYETIADTTLTMDASRSHSENFTIESANPTYKMILDCNDKNLSGGDITVGTRGVILGGSGTITCAGNWNSSAGIFTREGSSVTLSGTSKNITMNVSDACTGGFYNLTVNPGASYTLQSNAYYWNAYTNNGSVTLNGYIVTNCGGAGPNIVYIKDIIFHT
jgi:hypothetical protein